MHGRIEIVLFLTAMLLVSTVGAAEGKLLPMSKVTGEQLLQPDEIPDNTVAKGIPQARATRPLLNVERDKPWSLPKMALADDFADTINCLVLRFDFQYEDVDDPNTTGRGMMDMTPFDQSDDAAVAAYLDSVGHLADPPPHNTYYFNAHMEALREYWETASEGKITLTWKIYPEDTNSTYILPEPMSHYGVCYLGIPADSQFIAIIRGLERYFEDGLRVADSASPEINFAEYDSYFMFHAGSDQQQDIGFPQTCSDLYTGYISYYDTVWVDSGLTPITDAVMMPETMSQDNRATAMNATIAHEFGHQLGLLDMYRTDNFVSCLGDFALMDYNGFGTAVDFGWAVGRVFGALPVFPSAWSRAYLGVVQVHDFRAGTDIEIAAAQVVTDGIKIARVPISENEYYLIENRAVEIDGYPTNMRADSRTGVFQYPARDMGNQVYEATGEYDFLIPGSGLLIYLVDEGVAYLNNDYYTGDTVINFNDNKVQWALGDPNPSRKFVTLIEADGVVDLSGYYQTYGEYRYGWEGDMFREDRKTSFTPNTNPAAIDNSYNNTHVRITGIGRGYTGSGIGISRTDSIISFDLETDMLCDGFPFRTGTPTRPYSPIIDDLDGDGHPEIIVASGRNLCVTGSTGENFIHRVSGCDPCIVYADSAKATVHPGQLHPLPLYYQTLEPITANPVTGDFDGDTTLVAVGFTSAGAGRVELLAPFDEVGGDGLADRGGATMALEGTPIAMSFGSALFVLTDSGTVHLREEAWGTTTQLADLDEDEYFGLARLGSAIIVLAGDTIVPGVTSLHYLSASDSVSYEVDGRYNFGPILADIDGDSDPEVIAFSEDGDAIMVSVDTDAGAVRFAVRNQKETGYHFTTNPVLADIDRDGRVDIVIGGTNTVHAFNTEFTIKSGFPIEISDRYDLDDVIAAPVVADIQSGGLVEMILPTLNGNIWSLGPEVSFGFPLSGGEMGIGSPVVFTDSTGGKLGYVGLDGWFYCWRVDADEEHNCWPMYGADPGGSFAIDMTDFVPNSSTSSLFPEDKFYNYPNPVDDGRTTIRYYLDREATRVDLTLYDLSGQRRHSMSGPGVGGIDNEISLDCSGLTPGVYRCVIEIDFGSETKSAFTDIAIIR